MIKSFPKEINFAKQYPFLLLLIALSAGIMLQPELQAIKAIYWLLLIMVTGAAAALLHIIRSTSIIVQRLRTVTILISFLGLGAALTCLQDIRNSKQWYGHYLQHADALLARIEEAPAIKERTVLLPVTISSMEISNRWIQVKGALQLYVYRKEGMPEYKVGQTLLFPPDLLLIKSSGNPFALDYAAYAARKGLHHQAFLPYSSIRVLEEGTIKRRSLSSLRNMLQQSISTNVKDSTTRALIEAILLNERASLDEELWKAYSVTGVVHIIAISGMHIILLAGLLLFLLRIIPYKRLDKLKYTIAITVIWCYIALTGFPPSAVRAALMFTLAAIGLMLNRTSNPINIWATAGFLLLCYNPYWIYDVGVQLSFLAVLSILLFYKPVKRWYTPSNLLTMQLWQVIAVSIAVQVLVAPLVIYYFHQFPVMGLLANVPAALFSIVLLYGALFLFLFYLLGIPCLWLGKLLSWVTLGFHYIIRFLADHTPLLMQRLYLDPYEYWLTMLVITAICLFLFYKRSVYLYTGLIIAVFFFGDLMLKELLALKQDRIVVYNVSRHKLADVYRGKHVIPVYKDSIPDKMTAYTLSPARLAFRAMEIQEQYDDALFRIGNATVLFLDRCDAIKQGTTFAVDFLVVSHQCHFDPEAWYRTFHPRKIIIDGSLPRWKATLWKQQLESMGAHVHWVQEDGAWVFPATRD